MMSSTTDIRAVTLGPSGFGQTTRRDAWWATPLATFLVLSAFVVYATWAAFQNAHYTFGPYLSPFYSPEIFGDPAHAWVGGKPGWWPSWLPFSPALIILPFPAFFRLTCYYYRGAYYKAFWADPPSCAVGEPRSGYRGERSFPLIMQNVHRYFLYAALGFLVVLSWDVWKALWFRDPSTGRTSFGIGVGTLVLALNVVLLAGYTLGCHSLRHLVGGRTDEVSKRPTQEMAYACVSCLNRRHMPIAWCSLIGVAFADLYVRLCSMGIWTDWRIL
jgi:hypothetical protein